MIRPNLLIVMLAGGVLIAGAAIGQQPGQRGTPPTQAPQPVAQAPTIAVPGVMAEGRVCPVNDRQAVGRCTAGDLVWFSSPIGNLANDHTLVAQHCDFSKQIVRDNNNLLCILAGTRGAAVP